MSQILLCASFHRRTMDMVSAMPGLEHWLNQAVVQWPPPTVDPSLSTYHTAACHWVVLPSEQI